MQDNLDPRDYRNPPAPKGDAPRPITDREVPLTGQLTPAAIHSWLDGELSESAVRQSDASRDVDFWLRLDREVQVRRQMTTPTHLSERAVRQSDASHEENNKQHHEHEVQVRRQMTTPTHLYE